MSPRTAQADETPDEGAAGVKQRRRRLAPEDREHEIVQSAISFFARHGFEGSTRDLAQRLGVSQSLLYRDGALSWRQGSPGHHPRSLLQSR